VQLIISSLSVLMFLLQPSSPVFMFFFFSSYSALFWTAHLNSNTLCIDKNQRDYSLSLRWAVTW
jgi:hypothetical protein